MKYLFDSIINSYLVILFMSSLIAYVNFDNIYVKYHDFYVR